MANINITIRMDEDLKARADELFDDLGMSFTTAVNIFVKQALREGRIPFEISSQPSIRYAVVDTSADKPE
ncbi:MAG: type II toxin-antitoxin system RelB/DinJ family antitoxin [Eggerthellaceae bacterium]|nr:type II toxin-antitoxin system RelB/DinJ family antitoxin [Eggerthellaceae bacterium]